MKKDRLLTGLVMDQHCTLTLDEFSCACSMRIEWVIDLVEEGILEPVGGQTGDAPICFAATTLVRARRVMRLQRDLGINLSGAALALELMDEMDALRARLRAAISEE